MSNNEIWQSVLAELELAVSKANFITWFKNTGIISLREGQALLCVPNAFTKAWLEKKYHHQLITSLERITEKPIRKLEYKIDNIKSILEANLAEGVVVPADGRLMPQFSATKSLIPTNGGFALNPRYTFDNFVVGRSSELAYAAAQAVATRPGVAYNPLFIYGGVGLGKTHLLQAVGNELSRLNPSAAIMYASAEKFSNDFITSVREKTAKDFQNRYRHIDVLLIDDIQFIAGKVETQESFFHTFNELHQQNKQVILTSDRPPKAIPALEERLKSRFEWGMIADVAVPDFETRAAILEKKCLEKNFPLDSEMVRVIAAAVQSNIRELEGALNKIIVYHQLKNIPPSIETIKPLLLTAGLTSARRSLTARQLLEAVGQYFSLSTDEILGKNREKKISLPRQIIMFLMREELKMSYPAIGDELGGRDHTTAMHAHEKIVKEIEQDLRLRQEIDLLKQRLYVNNI